MYILIFVIFILILFFILPISILKNERSVYIKRFRQINWAFNIKLFSLIFFISFFLSENYNFESFINSILLSLIFTSGTNLRFIYEYNLNDDENKDICDNKIKNKREKSIKKILNKDG